MSYTLNKVRSKVGDTVKKKWLAIWLLFTLVGNRMLFRTGKRNSR